MKELKLRKVTILSLKEKKGKIIDFDEKINVIIGENDTGKSSLIKSIYYAFGAQTKMHPGWKAVNPIVIVDFDYGNESYKIMRNGKEILFFNSKLDILSHSHSITNEFSKFFSEFFGFKINLTDKDGIQRQANPAYNLLPFYIDQDIGWARNWNSFENLLQFKKWRQDIIFFHTGARPGEYYSLKSQKEMLNDQKKEIEAEMKVLESIYNESIDEFKEVTDMNISLDEFKEEIDALLIKLNEEKKEVEKHKQELKYLYDEKYLLEGQIKITKRSLEEIHKDYNFSVSSLGSEVECPTCGTIHENSFAQRFDIAKDENACLDLLNELTEKLKESDEKINMGKKELFKKNKNTENIETLLASKKRKITLMELLDYKGTKSFIEILEKKLGELKNKLKDVLGRMNEITKKMAQIESPERKKEIATEYRKSMKDYLEKLNVHNLSYDSYKDTYSTIDESGSDKPRALLAYFFSILKALKKFSTSGTFFPIIIDAPKQQEQDKENSRTILEFIRDECPKGAQLILGIVDLEEVKFEGKKIELKEKLSLLEKESYQKCMEYYKELKARVSH